MFLVLPAWLVLQVLIPVPPGLSLVLLVLILVPLV